MGAIAMGSFLENSDLRLVFFGGKGGVGKTTCAAATVLHYARRSPQGRFLLISTDPAHSLVDIWGDLRAHSAVKILEFNAHAALNSFKDAHQEKFAEIARRGTFLDDDDLGRILELSLPGLDELMALIEISREVKSQVYDCIVVDTAPTGHTLRLLNSPKLIRNWLKALEALLAQDHYFREHFQGSCQSDELDSFLNDLAMVVKNIEELLKNPQVCCFVPVMVVEELIVSETLKLLKELKRIQIPIQEIVVNRLYPKNSCAMCGEVYQQQQRILTGLSGQTTLSGLNWVGLPLCPEETRGVVLTTLWDRKITVDFRPEVQLPPLPEIPSRVDAPLPFPSASFTFLILAGKGGVGKTTLACATALHLNLNFPEKEILLFSTDPAHSLSSCLETSIGPRPVRLNVGLSAMEIDAPGEFSALKNRYREELNNFLELSMEHFDIPFDRMVLERILDLAPPGLDEIMALVKTMGFLAKGSYDLFILDSAPTGHLFRLIELPELIDRWLKTFFNLFLKYHLTHRFPDLSQKLVNISRELKLLKNLWRDPTRTAVYAVAILTELGFQEIIDLLAACTRMGIATPSLLLNQVTPDSNCLLCNVIHRREMLIKDKYQKAFANRHQTIIYRQSVPKGLKELMELGQAMYLPRMMENLHGAVVDLPAMSN
jgi:arsenite-transporting ATPase